MDTATRTQLDRRSATLVLDVARDGDFITVGIYPLATGPPLRGYEKLRVDWPAIAERCRELAAILGQVSAGRRPTFQGTTTLRRVGHTLFDQLLTTHAKQTLQNTRVDLLHLAVDEQLAFIPWEMLHDGVLFWSQRYAIGRTVRTQHPVEVPVPLDALSPRRLLIVADPQGNLPGAHTEGCRLRSFLSARLPDTSIQLITSRVTVTQVRDRLRECDIIHYAGHAQYDGNHPEQRGWRLHDGDLSLQDLTPMAGGGPLPALVFANACNSGPDIAPTLDHSAAHGAQPLANAFILAGVRHYLGTTWEIPDEAGATFASAFYDRLLAGAPIGVAVRLARLACLAEYGEGSVIWASYLLYGDPTVRYFPYAVDVESVPSPPAVERDVETTAVTRPVTTRSAEQPIAAGSTRFVAASAVLLMLVALVVFVTHWPDRRDVRHDGTAPDTLLRGVVAEATDDWQTAATAFADGLRHAPDDPYLRAFAGSMQTGGRQDAELDRSQRVASLIDRIAAYAAAQPETPAEPLQPPAAGPLTVAVLGVDAHHAPSLPAAVGIDVEQRLSRLWEQEPRLRLVDRQHLERVLEELHLTAAKLARPDSAVPLGALASAQFLATGEIIELGDRFQLTVRLVETATSTVVAAASQLFATVSQVDGIVTRAAAELTGALSRRYPIHAQVIESGGDRLTLNVGADLGVAPADLFRTVGVNDGPAVVLRVERVDAHSAVAQVLTTTDPPPVPPGSPVEQVWEPEG